MAVYQYDPAQVSIVFGSHIVTGYADGTFVTVERNEDSFGLTMGADGTGSRAKMNNRSAQITITVQQTSPSNDYFSSVAATDEASMAGVQPFLMRDGSGRTVVTAKSAWIKKPPSVEFGKEIASRAWVLETENAQLVIAGN